MKALPKKAVISLAIFWFAILSSPVRAAEYFVVIGAFSNQPHAVKFTDQARKYFEEVSWSYHEQKQLFFVHVMKTSRHEEAKDWTQYIKQQTQFKDAWVLTDADPEEPVYANASAGIRTGGYATDKNYSTGKSDRTGSLEHTNADGVAIPWTASRELSYLGNITNVKNLRNKAGFSSAHVFTFIIENHLGNPIDAEVKLIDFAMVRKIASFRSGEHMAIRGTKREQVITLECDVLGYTMETRMFNLDHLGRSKDIRLNKQGVWEVRFRLKPLTVHDVSFMHKTTFYENSAVLNPSSKAEMNELLTLMKTRQGYRIVIHSHCNPGGKRDLILPGETNNYFDLEGSTVVKSGSDKKLTTARAEVLRDFLLANGIDKDRLRVVGWGSDDLLTPANAKDAWINERIEIELVDL